MNTIKPDSQFLINSIYILELDVCTEGIMDFCFYHCNSINTVKSQTKVIFSLRLGMKYYINEI